MIAINNQGSDIGKSVMFTSFEVNDDALAEHERSELVLGGVYFVIDDESVFAKMNPHKKMLILKGKTTYVIVYTDQVHYLDSQKFI